MTDWQGLLATAQHRPWPLPTRPWSMTMSWVDLLFAHWSVPVDVLRAQVPSCLELDLFEDRAFIGVVPFRMEAVGPRGAGWLPARMPSPRAFPELNVRTYVRIGERPGVFFFSLDATSRLAVWAARRFFHLPYMNAAIRCQRQNGLRQDGLRQNGLQQNGWLRYDSQRRDRRGGEGDFVARYRPSGDSYSAAKGSLEHWLTERYCLYAVDTAGRAWRGDVHHQPWPLRPAVAEIERQTVAQAHGFALAGAPELVHFADHLDVVAWWPRRVEP